MEIRLYPRLSTRSKRALVRRNGRFGRPYFYQPRPALLQRLSTETGLSTEECWRILLEEREFLLKFRLRTW